MKAHVILTKGLEILDERGAVYENGKEDSFDKVAQLFTIKTGIKLEAYHVALLLSELKDVRQFTQDRLHEDSIIDGVNYKALMGEKLYTYYNQEKKTDGTSN